MSKYSIQIWDVLKFEILNAQEEFLSELSLQALNSIAKRLSEGIAAISEQSPLAQFLRPITKECNEQLREPQQKQAKPAQQILNSTSSASTASFTVIVQAVVAPLLTVYQEADGLAKQRAILETLGVSLIQPSKFLGNGTPLSLNPPLKTLWSNLKISSRTSLVKH